MSTKLPGLPTLPVFIALGAMVLIHCADDAVYDPALHRFAQPHAFVVDHAVASAQLSDTAGFRTSDTVSLGDTLWFVGVVSGNADPALRWSWELGDAATSTEKIAQHTYALPGRYLAKLTITDAKNNFLSDSVTCLVLAHPVFGDALFPPNGDDAAPFPPGGGMEFHWEIASTDPADSVVADVYFGPNPLALPLIGQGLTGGLYEYHGTVDSATTYYWRVVLRSVYGGTVSSAVYQFTTAGTRPSTGPYIKSMRGDTAIDTGVSIPFFAVVVDSSSTVTEYAWDFDGNGSYDYASATSATTTHAYARAGVYEAKLRVLDAAGDSVVTSTTITVRAPAPALNGPVIRSIRTDTTVVAGGQVAFSATATDSGGAISDYAWDFDGNGSYDYTNATTATTTHVYAQAGVYTAVLRVTGAGAKTAFDTVKITVSGVSPIPTGPTIRSIRADTAVVAGDQVPFRALATDSGSAITEYAWDFEGDGTFDFTSTTTATTTHAYAGAGTYTAVLRVTDAAAKTALDTVTITATSGNLTLAYRTPDMVIEYQGTVRCSIAVATNSQVVKFEIDTASTGGFVPMKSAGKSATYSFTTATATVWGSVKIRVTTAAKDTLPVQFDVSIRPRVLTIATIDSTDSTVTVRWSQSAESDFVQYRVYRAATNSVDTSSELWATITQSTTVQYTTPTPGRTFTPRHYRVYQKDAEGLWSVGSNVVFGDIRNSPPVTPVILIPDKNSDTLWSNAVLRWNRCSDPNGDAVTYAVQLTTVGGTVTYATGITDTFVQLRGLDTLSFTADVQVVASDVKGATSSAVRLGVVFKLVRSLWMRTVPAGSFVDGLGNTARVSYGFLMDTTEVTQARYTFVMGGENPSQSQNDRQPVEDLTWYQAIQYCNALSEMAGVPAVYTYDDIDEQSATNLVCHWDRAGFRLPTEDEWELAARGGTQANYATDDGTLSCTKAKYSGAACPQSTRPVAVGSYAPNPWGMRDMTGNVSEWCWDQYSATRSNGRVDYTGPESGSNLPRIRRGGDYTETNLTNLQTGTRAATTPNSSNSRYGFRCVFPILP